MQLTIFNYFSKMVSSTTCLLLLGSCLLFNGVQSGVKSPYRKTEDLNVSGEKGLGGDNSAEYRVQQRENTQIMQQTLLNLTTQFQQFRTNMETHVQQIQTQLDQQCRGGCQGHGHYGNEGRGAPLGSDPRTYGPGNQPLPGSDPSTYGPGNQPGYGGHGGHGSQCGRPRNYPRSFMRPPRVRNPEDYDFAICNVKPNSKISSNVTGRIIMMQRRDSPTTYISIRVRGFNLHPDHEPFGDLVEKDGQTKTSDRLEDVSQARQDFSEQLSQLSKTGKTSEKIIDNGHLHGLRIHSIADLSDGCDSTGDDYNPYNARHGGPNAKIRHVGDLGNIECDDEGASNQIITDDKASLRGQYSIIGKPLVIHQSVDDYSPYAASATAPGDRVACCIIEKIPSNLYNEYEFYPSQSHGSSGHSSADFRDGQRPGNYDIPSGPISGGSSHYPGTGPSSLGGHGSHGGHGGHGAHGGQGGYGTRTSGYDNQGQSGYNRGQGGYNRGQGNRIQPNTHGFGSRDHSAVTDHDHDHGTGTGPIVGGDDRYVQRQDFQRGKNPYSGNV